MKFLKKLLAPKEVRVAFGVLDEIGFEFNNEGFHILRNIIEDLYLKFSKDIATDARNGLTPRRQIYTSIGNIAGDLLESGRYHMYRGVLNPLGPGGDFLRLYNFALDNLVQSGAIDEEFAKEQRTGLQENIKNVG